MNYFKNSKTAKVVSGFVALAAVALMVGPSIASADSYVFTKTLKMGTTDTEVWNLQKTLNSSVDTQVAASGVGSTGMESKYFGAKTKVAVIKFQEKYASDILTPNGLTKGTGLVGAATRAKLNMMSGAMTGTTPSGSMSTVPGCTSTTGFSPITGQSCGSMVTTTTTASGTSAVSAMVDVTSPMMGSVIQGQAIANLGVFRLTNSGSAPAKVMSVKFMRTGISSDTNLKNVYLYQGANRLTDSASVASGVVSFNDPSGIVTIPAMSSILITVAADVDPAATPGSTVGMTLTMVTTDGSTVGGIPASAAIQSVVTAPTDIMKATFTGLVTPNGGTVDPQTDYVMWQGTLNVSSRDARLNALRFQQIGSVNAADLSNFRLMIDGVQVGSSVASVDSNRYVNFDFTAAPLTVKSGTRTIKLVGDIVGGSNRNLQFSIRRAGDISILDSQLGVNVTVVNNANTNTGTSFLPVDSSSGGLSYTPGTNNGAVAITQGNLTFTKTTDSVSGNVVFQGSQITLGKFNLKAAGESMKVENLKVSFTKNAVTAATGVNQIRNGALFVNGTQVGSTQSIDTVGTTFNLGSALVVVPGHDATLEIRGDVYNNGTGAQYTNGDTLQVSIAAGASNVLRVNSLGYTSSPSSAVPANSVTVATGAFVLSKYTAYANQTVVVPQTGYKIGEFRVSAGTAEGVNLNTVNVTGLAATTSMTDIYLVYGPVGGTMKTSQVKSSSGSTLSWSLNDTVAANANYVFEVHATLNSALVGTVSPSIQVTGTGVNSGNSVDSGTVAGQTMTVGAGTLTAALDASVPVSAIYVGGTMPKVASYKFTASNDSFTIDQLNLAVTSSSTADAAAISEVVIKDGTTELKRQSLTGLNGTSTIITGLAISIPANGTKVLDVYLNLGNVGTPGYAAPGANVGITLTGYSQITSTGVKTFPGTWLSSNSQYVYKTKPTITNVALPTTVLTAGTQTIYQFSVTADAGGTVAWRTIKFNVATTSAPVSLPNLYDSANQSSVLPNTTCTFNTAGSVVTCVSTQDQEVSGSKTYVLKATVASAIVGSSVSTSIAGSNLGFVAPTAAGSVGATATFVWSDESVTPHTALTNDWNNDSLVKNLPTDSETMSK